MASEIADSDAESETLDTQDTAHEPRGDGSLAADGTVLAAQISPPRVDFDDFLGPTQILSDQSLLGEGSPGCGTGSTEKRLHRLGTAQQNLAASSMDTDMDLRHSADEAASFPVDQVRVNNTGNDQATANQDTHETSSSIQTIHLQADHATARPRDGLGRAINLLGNTSTSITTGYPAKTMSSYGGYQSIELNFRAGLDYDVNPFGEMTQASMDGAAAGDTATDDQQVMIPPDTSEEHVRAEALPSPSLQAQNSRLDCPLEPQSKRRKTEDFSRAITTSPAPSFRRATSASAEPISSMSDNPQPKKRGRPPKSRLADSAAPEDMAPPDPPTSTRSRPGTLDSSQPSHEETPSNTKRKRRRSKAETKAEEASLLKHPSSKLQPDDEELIGLPKENYKPRPSRRRSKPLVPEGPADLDSSVPLLESAEGHPQKPGAEGAAEDSHTKSSKKTRKSKVKRAKTSATALLKKSCQMISDGEDDVLWVDEKPTAVKLELPPHLKKLKKEADTEVEFDAGARILPQKGTVCVEIPVTAIQEKTNEPAKNEPDRSKPTVVPSDSALDKAPTPEPLSDAEEDKIEKQQTNKDTEADDEPTGPCSPRLPLASKSANTPSPLVPASSSGPLKPSPEDEEDKENTELSRRNQQEQQQHTDSITTVSTMTTPPSKKMPRGPTSHSPIAPASAWNSQSRFRVGLSKRQSIPSLLRKVDKTKAAPTKVGVQVKERKVKEVKSTNECDGDGDGDGNSEGGILRDKDGNLVEWEF